MATNRDYTGLVRTPTSMAWLIRIRGTIRGKLERRQGRIRADRKAVSTFKKQLKAVDAVILAHEVEVNPTMVLPVKTYRPRIARRGEMGRFLVEELKAANGTRVPATELAIRFLRRLGLGVTMLSLKDMRSRVALRLNDLAAEGRVVARHVADDKGWIVEGYWSFPLIDPED